MTNAELYPLLFRPVYKDYIWGGRKIVRRYQRRNTPEICAESWEIADRPEGMSMVVNGPLAGQDLFGLMKSYGEKLTGRPSREFPLLVKIIDAREKLSVQVHPDEAGAQQTGGDPKTEMWYVLEADPQAVVYAGFKPGVTSDSFKEALKQGRAAELLQSVPVEKGDVIFIPGGRIHAIGEGCLMLEVMQNSDTTFRLYDWNRVGRDGKPRALQMSKAFKVIRWDDTACAKITSASRPLQCDEKGNGAVELLKTPFFRFEKVTAANSLACAASGNTFHILFIEDGNIELAAGSVKMNLEAGQSVLVPAALPEYSLTPRNKPASILRISLP